MNKNRTLSPGAYFIFVCILAFSLYQTFSGCTSSDEPEVGLGERAKDSIALYTKLEEAFGDYKSALQQNAAFEDLDAKKKFESAVKKLYKVDQSILEGTLNYKWRADYNELATSVVQDYLITQKDIADGSEVFRLAERVGVQYEKVKQYTENVEEPLPDGTAPGSVPLIKNEAVQEYIDFFSKTDRGRSFMDKVLYRSGKYFPLMRKILRNNDAPEEFIYLSVQESGLDPRIISRAGAVGLWQFMPATGYEYNLYQDQYRDDRRDFEKATESAAKFLKRLNRNYDDWYLSFAAYNAGPGRVNSALKKASSRSYWDVRSYLPGETKNYVPSILALSFIFRDPTSYGFKAPEYGKAISFDRVNIKGTNVTFEQIAKLCECEVDEISELNSELMVESIPLYDVPYQMRIPHGKYNTFAANVKKYSDIAIITHEFAGNEKNNFGTSVTAVEYKVIGYEVKDIRTVGSSTGMKVLKHNYIDGELLTTVSAKYYVKPSHLRIWNNLSYGTYPMKGNDLLVYLDEPTYNLVMNIPPPVKTEETKVAITSTETNTPEVKTETVTENTSSSSSNESTNIVLPPSISTIKSGTETETTKKETTKKETTKTEVKEKTKKETPNKKSQTYVVKEGDYLGTIAKEYEVDLNDLKEWNDISDDKILVGQKLKIYSDVKPEKESSIVKGAKTHTVQDGEYLTLIAKKYKVSLEDLRDWNELDDDVIQSGQVLVVKEPVTTKETKNKTTGSKKKTYKVKKGDTLASISAEFDVTIKDLKKWNKIKDDTVMIGQILNLTGDTKKK